MQLRLIGCRRIVVVPGPEIRHPDLFQMRKCHGLACLCAGRSTMQAKGCCTMDDGRKDKSKEEEFCACCCRPMGMIRVERMTFLGAEDPLRRHCGGGMERDDSPGLEVLVDDEEARHGAEAIEQDI